MYYCTVMRYLYESSTPANPESIWYIAFEYTRCGNLCDYLAGFKDLHELGFLIVLCSNYEFIGVHKRQGQEGTQSYVGTFTCLDREHSLVVTCCGHPCLVEPVSWYCPDLHQITCKWPT